MAESDHRAAEGNGRGAKLHSRGTTIRTQPRSLQEGINYLDGQGLNLVGVLDCATLPDNVRDPLSAGVDLSTYARLVVLGNSGQSLWAAVQAAGMAPEHPIDSFSTAVTHTFCARFLTGHRCELVFPTEHTIPLQRVGALLGWGEASPLGIAINPRQGLWFAYRSAFLTSAELPVSEPANDRSPCLDCVDQPCISACPASAVSSTEPFAVPDCFRFRAIERSPCVDQCLARQACPVAPESRYPRAMIHYIYETSMSTVRRYCSEPAE